MLRAFFCVSIALIMFSFANPAIGEPRNLFADLAFECVESRDPDAEKWSATCTHQKMDAELFVLRHDINIPSKDIVDFFTLADTERRAWSVADYLATLLDFADLAEPPNANSRNAHPAPIFELPSSPTRFCQFGISREMERTNPDHQWKDWRRFRCYVPHPEGFLVINFTPNAWNYPTSYFVNLIDVLLVE